MTHEQYEAWKAERYPLWDKLMKAHKWKGDYAYYAPDRLRELVAQYCPEKTEKPKAEAKPKVEPKPKAKKAEKVDVAEIVAKDEKCLAIIEDAKKAKAEGNAEKLAELKAALENRIAEIKAA